jgi:hypothetical protein
VRPDETESEIGEQRFFLLREMYRAITLQSAWISVMSNWTLGATGAYLALIVANFDKVHPHLRHGGQWFAFAGGVCSALTGIVIQLLYGLVQFDTNLEDRILTHILTLIRNSRPPGNLTDFINQLTGPVIQEFIDSRPWPFKILSIKGREKGLKDVVWVPKVAATISQIILLLLLIQLLLLGVAIFGALARLK